MVNYCKICGKEITHGNYWITEGFCFHVDCFRCSGCNNLLRDGDTCLKDGRYYCKKDFLKKWGIQCKKCGKFLNAGEQYLEFDGNCYHNVCMTCSVCSRVIYIGSKFYTSNNLNKKLLCGDCVAQNTDLLESGQIEDSHQATTSELPSDPTFMKSTAINVEDFVDGGSGSTQSIQTSASISGGEKSKQKKLKYSSVMKSIFATSFDMLL